MTSTRILVTGTAGFIGFHLAHRLCRDGFEVEGIDNVNSYYDPGLKRARLKELAQLENFVFHEIDLADMAAVEDIFTRLKPHAVIHLAAQAGVRYSLENPKAYTDSNITGFLSILEGCRHNNVDHLIFASSSSVYGANEKLPYQESDGVNHPVSLYAATKKSNELMAHSYAHLYGLPCTGLRFFTVYGPWGRPDMAYFKFTKEIFEGTPINLFNHGQMQRDFTYIDDIIEGVVRLIPIPATPDPGWSGHSPDPATSYAPYRIYNIGNNTPVNLKDMVRLLEGITGRTADKRFLDMQPGDVLGTWADIDALHDITGFTPSTPLNKGLAHFVRWYRDYYRLGNGP